MQIPDFVLAFLAQGVGLVFAVISVLVALRLTLRENLEAPKRRTKAAIWLLFCLVVTLLQAESIMLLLGVGHYAKFSGPILSSVFLIVSGWLSLKRFRQ